MSNDKKMIFKMINKLVNLINKLVKIIKKIYIDK